MMIDAHQHFWKYNSVRDAWITDQMKVLRRNFLPEDLQPILQEHAITGCVAVQADQSEQETHFLLELAQKYDVIKGIVGWVDLRATGLESLLESYHEMKLLKGFRHIIQAEPKGFMLDPKFINGVSLLGDFGYTYDILIFENQLPEALEMIRLLPELPLVIDHIAKPQIKTKSFADWYKSMRRLAEVHHVSVKLSGMVTEASWQDWESQDILPYLEATLELFGPQRLLYGSDWPVCLLASSYKRVFDLVHQFTATLSREEQKSIMGQNALRLYKLE